MVTTVRGERREKYADKSAMDSVGLKCHKCTSMQALTASLHVLSTSSFTSNPNI
jgi:hypothetical protein